jgi:sulfoxide reductase heme-binding subunit YedZ
MSFADNVNRGARKVPSWAVYIVGAIPALTLLYGTIFGGLGVDPIRTLEHDLGKWALKFIIIGLCISPLRRWGGVNLVKYRRAIGLMAFYYIVLHLTVWLVLDLGLRFDLMWGDILKRPYITIGMSGFLLLIPLAVTSNNWSVRRLGTLRWQKLHKLVYPAALAGGLHFIMLVKAWPPEPIIYLTIIVGLLALRMVPRRARVAA